MFSKKAGNVDNPKFEKIDTLIGKGTSFEGNIVANGTIRIDGEIKGEIKAKGDLVVGESGRVDANIEGRNILVSGKINGNIQATGKMELAASAKLYGDIRVKDLIIEQGALFKGNCVMETASEVGGNVNLNKITRENIVRESIVKERTGI